MADKIDATTPPEGVTLATRNEHLANNPPDDEAAVPAYVLDMIEAAVSDLRDGVSTSFDTLAEIATRLGQLAPRNNPTFTGNPSAPTQSAGNNSTRLATTAHVKDFAAPINNANLTGNSRANTPSAGDDSTRIATTAWLQGFFGSASSREFTAAGSHSYTWEWGTSSGLVIVRGAGAGGGGGGNAQGFSAPGTNGGGGGGISDGANGGPAAAAAGGAGYTAGGAGRGRALGLGGLGGGGGGSSAVVLGPDVYIGHGGGGGGGGANDTNGFQGSFEGGTSDSANYPSPRGEPGGGFLTNGGAGGTGSESTGGLGGAGEVRVFVVSGLSLSSTFSITIGDGGVWW